MPAVHKAVLTNVKRLKSKYADQVDQVFKAIDRLIEADKKRGLNTELIDLSNPAAMNELGGNPITSVGSGPQAKQAIDAAYHRLTPDYLLILGASDVVCHQSLKNPMPDSDPDVPSDLPYACDTPYSRDITNFLAPTRVVGRLPDLVGATDPTYLIEVLEIAAKYERRPRDEYLKHLGISAKVWKNSTALSLQKIFGSSAILNTSPSDGPHWTAAQLARRTHFINCHGSPADTNFYGEPGNMPIAHTSAHVRGKLSPGTVASVECCYGAELFDPQLAGGTPGICNEYLGSGAYGFFGSTNIAYGPAAGNSAADIITQDFLRHMLSGASLGRAVLQARQDYVLKNSVMNYVDLKTLAQFHLLGDPAIHGVTASDPKKAVAKGASLAAKVTTLVARATDRRIRREALLKNGLAIGRASNYVKQVATLSKKSGAKIDARLRAALGEIDEFLGHATSKVTTASLAPLAKANSVLPKLSMPSRIHVAVGKRTIKGMDAPQFVVAIIRETGGEAGEPLTLFSR